MNKNENKNKINICFLKQYYVKFMYSFCKKNQPQKIKFETVFMRYQMEI